MNLSILDPAVCMSSPFVYRLCHSPARVRLVAQSSFLSRNSQRDCSSLVPAPMDGPGLVLVLASAATRLSVVDLGENHIRLRDCNLSSYTVHVYFRNTEVK